MSNSVKVVIGANYGDEGKGTVVSAMTHAAKLKGDSVIVVLNNGGAQRGHTVYSSDMKTHHIYQHLGAGTEQGAATYIGRHFIINTMVFAKEYTDLYYMQESPTSTFIPPTEPEPLIYYHPGCRWSTPWDMMANQIIENHRGEAKHGTCGLGIWETVRRYRSHNYVGIKEFSDKSISWQIEYLETIKQYYMEEIFVKEGIAFKEIPEVWDDDELLSEFITSVDTFVYIALPKEISILNQFNTVIFENGQGLLLDEDNDDNYPYVTASKTGVDYAIYTIEYLLKQNPNLDIESIYVSRPYLTRHGFGPFPTEDLGFKPENQFETNVTNKWQGALRYGHLQINELLTRIYQDASHLALRKKTSICITHWEEASPALQKKLKDAMLAFSTMYISGTPNGLSCFDSKILDKG